MVEKMFIGEGKNRKIKLFDTEEDLETAWQDLTLEEKHEACLYQKFTVKFIKDHYDEIDFSNLSTNPYLTFHILDAFAKEISWKTICINTKRPTDAFLYNFRLRIDWDLILRQHQLDSQVLVHLAEAFRKSSLKEAKNKFWKALSKWQEMDDAFINAYHRYIDFDNLSMNLNVSETVLDKFAKELNPVLILDRTDISKEFILKHFEIFSKNPEVVKRVVELQNSKKK